MSPGGEWLSAHLFYHEQNRGAADRVLRGVVQPFVAEARTRGWVERYFFIRYRELGPHVRLRLHGEGGVLHSVVRPALEAHVVKHLPPELAGTAHARAAGAGEPSAVAPSLWWIPYQPETARYGGPDGVRLAEELFFHSSEAALGLLECFEPGDTEARFGLALGAMVVLLGVLTRDPAQAADVALIHRDRWARAAGLDGGAAAVQVRRDAAYDGNPDLAARVGQIWAALGEGPDALPAPLDAYAAGAGAVAGRLQALEERGGLGRGPGVAAGWTSAIRALAPEYMHMMNNRLGVTPAEESYLAHFIVRCLLR